MGWQSWRHLHTLMAEKPYERMNISFIEGLLEAQKVALGTLGAAERGARRGHDYADEK